MRLLIVEKDILAAHILGLAARRLGHKTFAVQDWAESDGALPFVPTACVSGIEVLTPESWLPLLSVADRFPGIVTMLTATRTPDPAILLALRAGVGDVVRKPYNPFELIERIARLADANGNGRAPEICTLADLSVDLSHYSARKNGTDLRLTKLELRLLFCLLANSGRLAPTERLMTFGWEGMEPPEPSLLKTHISHLRSKLQDAGGVAIEINARHSLGYAIALGGTPASAEVSLTLPASTRSDAGRALDPLSTSESDASTPTHDALGGTRTMVLVRTPSSSRASEGSRALAGKSSLHRLVDGVPIFDGRMDDAARLCVEWIAEARGGRIATANLDFLAVARKDRNLKHLLAGSHLVVADGAPVMWLARLVGATRAARIGGADLVTEVLNRGNRRGALDVALYGSTDSVARDAQQEIERRFPNVRVVSIINPPFRDQTPQEEARDCESIRAASPGLVLVALGCPKQERLIERYFHAAPSAVWIGVGGTLEFLAGRRRRAPGFLQRVGLEWAVRLVQEPRRLWRRYLLTDLPVLIAVAPSCMFSAVRRLTRFGGPAN